jgi:AcrR family transcriptional regulator
MGRPSVKRERSEQIMAATARCVAEVGLAGLTLETVSAESGMSRGHIRHYVGNRDDLIMALVQWELSNDDPASGTMLPDDDNIDAMLDFLYGEAFSAPTDDNAVVRELLNAARTNDEIRTAMLDGYMQLRQQVADIVRRAHPGLTRKRAMDLAYALLALAIGNAVVTDLKRTTDFDTIVRAAAVALIGAQVARS